MVHSALEHTAARLGPLPRVVTCRVTQEDILLAAGMLAYWKQQVGWYVYNH